MNLINPEDAFEDHIKKPEYRRVRSIHWFHIVHIAFYVNWPVHTFMSYVAAKAFRLGHDFLH